MSQASFMGTQPAESNLELWALIRVFGILRLADLYGSSWYQELVDFVTKTYSWHVLDEWDSKSCAAGMTLMASETDITYPHLMTRLYVGGTLGSAKMESWRRKKRMILHQERQQEDQKVASMLTGILSVTVNKSQSLSTCLKNTQSISQDLSKGTVSTTELDVKICSPDRYADS